jgi:hypothetical protein
MKLELKEYREGDMVLMWDTKIGEPNIIKGCAKFWFGTFKIIIPQPRGN